MVWTTSQHTDVHMNVTPFLYIPQYSGTWEGSPGVSGTSAPLTPLGQKMVQAQGRRSTEWRSQREACRSTELRGKASSTETVARIKEKYFCIYFNER